MIFARYFTELCENTHLTASSVSHLGKRDLTASDLTLAAISVRLFSYYRQSNWPDPVCPLLFGFIRPSSRVNDLMITFMMPKSHSLAHVMHTQ